MFPPGNMKNLRQKAMRSGFTGAIAFRYLCAGLSASAINFLSRIALSQFMPFEYAVLVAQGIGFAAGFLFYRTFVFQDAATRLPQQVAAFAGVNLVSTAVVLACAIVLRGLLLGMALPVGYAEALAHAGGIASGAVINFLGHRLLTFARKTQT